MQTLYAKTDLLGKEMAHLHAEIKKFIDSNEGDKDESEEINDY
jgi:hypothetical protein